MGKRRFPTLNIVNIPVPSCFCGITHIFRVHSAQNCTFLKHRQRSGWRLIPFLLTWKNLNASNVINVTTCHKCHTLALNGILDILSTDMTRFLMTWQFNNVTTDKYVFVSGHPLGSPELERGFSQSSLGLCCQPSIWRICCEWFFERGPDLPTAARLEGFCDGGHGLTKCSSNQTRTNKGWDPPREHLCWKALRSTARWLEEKKYTFY